MSVRFERVSKTYGPVTAVNRVTLHVDKGEFVTLLGPSGSGKTTLLMILSGFVQPTAGDILIDGRSMVLLPPHKRNIGLVFQNHALFPHMSVFENIAYPLKLRRVPRAEIERRVEKSLEMMHLSGYGPRRIHELSGGQSQRVALARAVVFEPAIMLMDEPLSALDKKLREHMQVEIRKLHEELGITTIYVTHDQREALTMSDRVAVMNHGEVMQFDHPRAVYDRPSNGFVADFIGESAFIPITQSNGTLEVEGQPLRYRNGESFGIPPLSLVVRPEKLRLVSSSEARQPDVNYLNGRHQRAVFQGESVVHYIVLGSGTEVLVRDLVSRDRTDAMPHPGDAVTVALHSEDVLVVTAGSS